MALCLNTNFSARNAARTLGDNYSRLAVSVRRLSSGLRVSSAADDAAGLAIRELMRSDITTLNQGIRNANDAISMLQTADGALAVIDEKLIRMKELAEQAATGTYNSLQRLIIDSEFQAMASEIERIAKATDFNGIKLLDGTLSGPHDGARLTSTGAMKVHFGPGNDSAEDYYYVEIGDCTLAGLGLREQTGAVANTRDSGGGRMRTTLRGQQPSLNDQPPSSTLPYVRTPSDRIANMDELFPQEGSWYHVNSTHNSETNVMFIIPRGTKDIIINICGGRAIGARGDNDIELFTKSGIHLAGTPLDDAVFTYPGLGGQTTIDANSSLLGFTSSDYDGSQLNTGPGTYDPSGQSLAYSNYNGMTIGYSGDPNRFPGMGGNTGAIHGVDDYEVLTIDEATEDLIVWMPGIASLNIKTYTDAFVVDPPSPGPDVPDGLGVQGDLISVKTQQLAQEALPRLDEAIIIKDKVRAHLGATQNRLENTITNLSMQAENLQASESQISDVDVATEMAEFVRAQILSQSSVAMLVQANALPKMLVGLLDD